MRLDNRHGLLVLALLGSASTAAAQPVDRETTADPRDRRDRSAVSATAGVFAPTGTLGLEYAHVMHENLELAAGAGIGYLVPAIAGDDYSVAPQVALMPRVRVRFGAVRLFAGAGVSAGLEQTGYSPFSGDEGVDRFYGLSLNAEGGVQVISRGGWFGRAALGYGHVVAHTAPKSTEPGREPRMDVTDGLPYIGLAFGRTL